MTKIVNAHHCKERERTVQIEQRPHAGRFVADDELRELRDTPAIASGTPKFRSHSSREKK